MNKKIFWISLRAPYDTVPHAGGKTHNYLLKKIKENTKWDIRLLSFCRPQEKRKLDLDECNIQNDVLVIDNAGIKQKLRKYLLIVGLPPSLFEYGYVIKCVLKKVRDYKKSGYTPDIVILQWTEIVILLAFIKKTFPKSRIICIEEDVTFLKLERKYNRLSGVKKAITGVQLFLLKKLEIKSLYKSDLIVTYNKKDSKLLTGNGIISNNIFEMVPYFQEFMEISYGYNKNNILYYGAMNRPENEEAVLWFIKEVMPMLWERNKDFIFKIVGANPRPELKKYQNKNITITGYVQDVEEYFSDCLCMVVPLQTGAGIKIKVLEGMSAGVPILTNEIGIEGIEAEDRKNYIFCQSPQSYCEVIMKLYERKDVAEEIGENARNFILDNYNRKKKLEILINRIEQL